MISFKFTNLPNRLNWNALLHLVWSCYEDTRISFQWTKKLWDLKIKVTTILAKEEIQRAKFRVKRLVVLAATKGFFFFCKWEGSNPEFLTYTPLLELSNPSFPLVTTRLRIIIFPLMIGMLLNDKRKKWKRIRDEEDWFLESGILMKCQLVVLKNSHPSIWSETYLPLYKNPTFLLPYWATWQHLGERQLCKCMSLMSSKFWPLIWIVHNYWGVLFVFLLLITTLPCKIW